MARIRHSHLLIPLAAAALAVGACGDDKSGNPTPSDVTQAATVAVQVVDGDTRQPLVGAAVTGVVSDTVAGATELTDPVGQAIIPADGVAGVCADIPTHVKDCRTLLPGKTALTIPLYNPNLQSLEYGGGPARTRYVPAVNVPPPSGKKPDWTHTGKALLEFPPAVSRGTVVLTTNRGRVFAFNARTGAIKWETRHTEDNNIASTPAITQDGKQVIVSGMDGRLVSYSMANGDMLWEADAGRSPIESSPLIVGSTVYFGAHNGIIYAVDIPGEQRRRTARQIFQADDDVKSSLALAGDKLIFGDYSGNVYAIRVGDGKRLWKQSHGQRFYGGAGISRGIAVLGDVGGGVVGINVNNGRRIWRKPTGIVYASPAIARNTVFIGSYDERFYALDLESGEEKWSFSAGGRVGGSATVVGNTVYFSIQARRGEQDRTYGLDVRNQAVRYRGNDGRYSAGVAAGRTLYLVGRSNLYAYHAP